MPEADRILCAGVPLIVRARLAGELPALQLDVVDRPGRLLEALREQKYQALILFEKSFSQPICQLLDEISAHFHGPIVLVEQRGHAAEEMRRMVRSHHVTTVLCEPAPADDLVRAIVMELGLRRLAPPVSTALPEVDEVWRENRGQLARALESLESFARVGPSAEIRSDEISQALRTLVNNLGSFGLASAGLLAREAQQLVNLAMTGGDFRQQRLLRVVAALSELLGDHLGMRVEYPRLVLVSDDLDLCGRLDLEARLLNWSCESCADLAELPVRLSQTQTRVVVVDRCSATCEKQARLLKDLIADSFPTVILAEGPLPEDTPATRWVARNHSAYTIMLAAVRAQLHPSKTRPPIVLVVDDDRICLAMIERSLSLLDYHVEALSQPFEFWEMLDGCHPDLVILSADLPVLSGIELCRAMRLDSRYSAIPVVVTSGMVDSLTCHKAYQAGADDFLCKPIDMTDLRSRVSNRLERCRQVSAAGQAASSPALSSLDQLVLRSLREGIPLLLAVVEAGQGGLRRQKMAARLHGFLRSEDLVRPQGETRLLLAMLTAHPEFLEERVRNLVLQVEPQARVAFTRLTEGCADLEGALESARSQLVAAGE